MGYGLKFLETLKLTLVLALAFDGHQASGDLFVRHRDGRVERVSEGGVPATITTKFDGVLDAYVVWGEGEKADLYYPVQRKSAGDWWYFEGAHPLSVNPEDTLVRWFEAHTKDAYLQSLSELRLANLLDAGAIDVRELVPEHFEFQPGMSEANPDPRYFSAPQGLLYPVLHPSMRLVKRQHLEIPRSLALSVARIDGQTHLFQRKGDEIFIVKQTLPEAYLSEKHSEAVASGKSRYFFKSASGAQHGLDDQVLSADEAAWSENFKESHERQFSIRVGENGAERLPVVVLRFDIVDFVWTYSSSGFFSNKGGESELMAFVVTRADFLSRSVKRPTIYEVEADSLVLSVGENKTPTTETQSEKPIAHRKWFVALSDSKDETTRFRQLQFQVVEKLKARQKATLQSIADLKQRKPGVVSACLAVFHNVQRWWLTPNFRR